ncbi:nicotinate phosphoribosyltransferase [Sphaerobacter sp.]|uniref:nicotinate phosphoribosyltransferase n=1 Tax=Sphaerobacter sp. TaxID=2099654 RepID=UPI001D822098|nr:nicotinate phosphoribosyltransferase [Sphaerobacter sp.]MBX5445392.1 nicotinate phosphoribosyltransferase [Sphaerobacter sp.]
MVQGRWLHYATQDEIKAGRTTDVYFLRTVEILKAEGRNPHVRAEFIAKSLPGGSSWAVLAGLDEVAGLLDGIPVDVRAMPEGSIFHPYEPVMEISGPYLSFAVLETAILGLICQASGVATKAARIRRLAGDKKVVSFGARRIHPAVSLAVERAAYIGGCDGVSVVEAAELLGQDPTGTTPHALILIMGDTVDAMLAYDRILPPDIPRIALIDTFQDEKFEAIRVAEALGDRLWGVRLDTPSSRRGDFLRILEEVRWELDLRGFQHVKLIVSGGLDEEEVVRLRHIVDAFGVGTSISGAKTVDFSMDIVEIDGESRAKRGKMSGAKEVWRCPATGASRVTRLDDPPPADLCPDGVQPERALKPLLDQGRLVAPLPTPSEIREYVINQLKTWPLE